MFYWDWAIFTDIFFKFYQYFNNYLYTRFICYFNIIPNNGGCAIAKFARVSNQKIFKAMIEAIEDIKADEQLRKEMSDYLTE